VLEIFFFRAKDFIMNVATSRIVVALLLATGTTFALAGEASRADAQAQVDAAVKHVKDVGADQAAKDISAAPNWKVKGMNVNMIDYKGLVLASSLNEKLIGRNTWEVKDPNGKQFTKDFVATARQGGGWVDYQFINPQSKALEERSMYVKPIPGFDGLIGVAITK